MEVRKVRLLEAASRLVLLQGYNRTTIDDIARESGVKKGSVFYHFRSKEEIGLAILEQQARLFQEQVLSPSLYADLPPLERVTSFLDRMVDLSRSHDYRGGCPFANLAGEMADCHEGFRAALLNTFETVREGLAAALREASAQTGVAACPETLSRFVLATVEGAMMLTKVQRSGETLQAAVDSLKAYLTWVYRLDAAALPLRAEA